MSASMTSGTYPRAARPGNKLFLRGLNAVWAFLRDLGIQRARQHLNQLAAQREALDPALARMLRDAARHAGEV
ncbi:MAG: hypothetical protein JNL87_09640 [Burkholderiaceae bacterium]|nr:hypothetical protein [Burkholderiaceae bacterium]